MKYHYRNATGRTCCRANYIELLCDKCKPKALAALTRELSSQPRVASTPLPQVIRTIPAASNPPAVTVAWRNDDDEVPPPPSLADAIRALWAKVKPIGVSQAPATRVAAADGPVNANGVPMPPDLRTAVLAREGR
jgi:hypothetical protein